MAIIPTLMGSLGLEYITGLDWQAGDIDIHVPGDSRGWEAADEERIYQFDCIQQMMEGLGYELVDLHEHEFVRDDCSVEFGTIDSLPEFAGVELSSLPLYENQGVRFFIPNHSQFLKIYFASSQDSYRNDHNNAKDLKKIEFLKCYLNK